MAYFNIIFLFIIAKTDTTVPSNSTLPQIITLQFVYWLSRQTMSHCIENFTVAHLKNNI